MSDEPAGEWVSITELQMSGIPSFLQLASFGEVSLQVTRCIVWDYDAEELRADEEARAARAANVTDPLRAALIGGLGPIDRRHVAVVRSEYSDLPVSPDLISDVPLDHEMWKTGTLSRTDQSDPRLRFLYRDIRVWVAADAGPQPESTPGKIADRPTSEQLKVWARKHHAEREKAGRSTDWARSGQKALEEAFPGVPFKKSAAREIAKEIGLTRTYR